MTAVASANITKLADALRASGKESNVTTQRVAVESANFLLTEMEVLVPVGPTGKLRDSLTVRVEPDRIMVGPTASYAPFVEFPTRPHTIRAKNKRALSFMVDGKRVTVREVHHPGTKAQPFVRPAFERWVDSVGPMIAEANVKVIQDRYNR